MSLGKPLFVFADVRAKIKVGGLFAASASASGIYAGHRQDDARTAEHLRRHGDLRRRRPGCRHGVHPRDGAPHRGVPTILQGGSEGDQELRGLRATAGGSAVGYGVVAGIAIFVLAPLCPYILGSDFEQSIDALRWLAPLPAINALCYLSADALTGVGRSGIASASPDRHGGLQHRSQPHPHPELFLARCGLVDNPVGRGFGSSALDRGGTAGTPRASDSR